jgi:DNA-binding GntR family transcriptional regulator
MPSWIRALDRLAQKRVVEHVPNRGYHVYTADGKQASDIADIRIMLETGIVPKVLEQAKSGDIADLRLLATRFQELTLNGTILELYEANLNFHRAFVRLSGNGEIEGVIDELRQRTSSAPVSQWRTRARVEASAMEHHQMVDALEAKNGSRLKDLVEQHIRQR